MFALAGKPGEFPDQDLLEGCVCLRSLVEHLAELWPVGDAPTFCLIDVLAHDKVAVALGVIAQGAELRCHRKIDILALRRDAGVERSGGGVE